MKENRWRESIICISNFFQLIINTLFKCDEERKNLFFDVLFILLAAYEGLEKITIIKH